MDPFSRLHVNPPGAPTLHTHLLYPSHFSWHREAATRASRSVSKHPLGSSRRAFYYEPRWRSLMVHLAHKHTCLLDMESWKWTENGSTRPVPSVRHKYEMACFSSILNTYIRMCTRMRALMMFVMFYVSARLQQFAVECLIANNHESTCNIYVYAWKNMCLCEGRYQICSLVPSRLKHHNKGYH